MKTQAAVLYERERPRPYAQSRPLVVDEVELAGPGPGEVLVQVARAGLCHSDLSTIDGTRPWPIPMVLGHEACGIVREVGPGVSDLVAGDHVVFTFVPMCGRCVPCATGRPALCEKGIRANRAGTLLSGQCRFTLGNGRNLHHHLGVAGFSQWTVAAQESLVKIDPDFPLEKAALFGCAVLTGVGAVFNTARVAPGMSVAIFGLGGVGLAAVMGARAAGAWPIIAIDVAQHKLDRARRLGVTHCVDARDQEVVQTVRDLTAGGAHYAFECAGSEHVLRQAYDATRRGGMTITVGLPHPDKTLHVPAAGLVAEERTLAGSYMGSAVPRRDIPRYMAMYRAGLLPVDELLTGEIALDQINAGFDDLASGQAVRQLVRLTD